MSAPICKGTGSFITDLGCFYFDYLFSGNQLNGACTSDQKTATTAYAFLKNNLKTDPTSTNSCGNLNVILDTLEYLMNLVTPCANASGAVATKVEFIASALYYAGSALNNLANTSTATDSLISYIINNVIAPLTQLSALTEDAFNQSLVSIANALILSMFLCSITQSSSLKKKPTKK